MSTTTQESSTTNISRDQLEQEVNNLRSNFANLEALQHNTKVGLKTNCEFPPQFFPSQNDLMVAQAEVEKLREELSRVRTEGAGNLFGKNISSLF